MSFLIIFSHCEKIGLNEEIPLWAWFARGFSGVLHFSALEKIWDKVLGGSMKILVYVALTKVELSQNALLGCHTAAEAIRSLSKVIHMYLAHQMHSEGQIIYTNVFLNI